MNRLFIYNSPIMRDEIWKPIPNTEGFYEVSSLGRVRRSKICEKYPWTTTIGRILKPQNRPNGYIFVPLKVNGKTIQKNIHSLVCEAFIGQRQKGKQVNHKNGVKKDNQINNLEYVTPSENNFHSRRFLNKCIGQTHGMAKLSNCDIKFIRNFTYKKGKPGPKGQKGSDYELAKKFNVHRSTIGYILNRKTWNHI